MSILEIVMGVVLIILAVFLTLVVLFQEGHQRSVGTVTGASSADTFFTKNKSRSIDSFLERWTRVIAIGFFLAVIATNAVIYFGLFSK